MTHVTVALGLSVAALCAVSVPPAYAGGHGGGGGYHGGGRGYHGGGYGYQGGYGYRGGYGYGYRGGCCYGGYGWWGPGVAFGLGLGAIAAAPYYYYPPPYYYSPPPVIYAPPQTYSPAPVGGGGQSCYAGAYVCPMDRPVATGAGCYCLGNGGQRVLGRAS
jgi:hypothetical protein